MKMHPVMLAGRDFCRRTGFRRRGNFSSLTPAISLRLSRSGTKQALTNLSNAKETRTTGDCMVVIYSRTGNGATDNETQVRAVMAP
jgi:ribosomal protein L18E